MSPFGSLVSLLALPAVVGGLIYFLRPWPRLPHMLAAAAGVVVAGVLRSFPVGAQTELIGRSLTLTAEGKGVLLAALGALVLCNGLLVLRPSLGLFASSSLVAFSLLALASCIENLTIGAMLLLAGGGAAALSLGEPKRPTGGVQYLTALTVGCLALAYGATAMEAAGEAGSRPGFVAVAAASGLLLGLVPFGFWELSLGVDAYLPAAAFISLALKPAALLLVWRCSQQFAWLGETLFPDLLLLSAAATVAYCSYRAAIAASAQECAAALVQGQFALLVPSLLPALGATALAPTTMIAFTARILPLVLLQLGWPSLLAIERRAGQAVLATLACLAMAGLPATPLFPVYATLALSLPRAARFGGLVAALCIGAGIACARLALNPAADHRREREQALPLAAIAFVAAATVAVGLHPQLLATYLQLR